MGRLGIQLGGVGARQAAHVPGELHHRQLHPQADTQEGHPVLPGEADGLDLALDAPFSKAAGHQNALDARQQRPRRIRRNLLRVHPADIH